MVRAQGTKKSIFFFWNIAVCVFLFTRFSIKIYVQDKGRKRRMKWLLHKCQLY